MRCGLPGRRYRSLYRTAFAAIFEFAGVALDFPLARGVWRNCLLRRFLSQLRKRGVAARLRHPLDQQLVGRQHGAPQRVSDQFVRDRLRT